MAALSADICREPGAQVLDRIVSASPCLTQDFVRCPLYGELVARIQRIRKTDKHHFFTVICRDLSEIARFARVDNWQYRLLKAFTPGPYTFVLQATREVPRRLLNERRRTVGIRVPDHPVVQLLLAEYHEPLMSTTLMLPGDDLPLTNAAEVDARIGHAGGRGASRSGADLRG